MCYHDMHPNFLNYLFIRIKYVITSLHSIGTVVYTRIGKDVQCQTQYILYYFTYIHWTRVLTAIVSALLMYGCRECLYTYIYHSPCFWMQQPTSYFTMHVTIWIRIAVIRHPVCLYTYSNCHWGVKILFTYHNWRMLNIYGCYLHKR